MRVQIHKLQGPAGVILYSERGWISLNWKIIVYIHFWMWGLALRGFTREPEQRKLGVWIFLMDFCRQ